MTTKKKRPTIAALADADESPAAPAPTPVPASAALAAPSAPAKPAAPAAQSPQPTPVEVPAPPAARPPAARPTPPRAQRALDALATSVEATQTAKLAFKELGDAGCPALAELVASGRIARLDCSNNSIGAAGATTLAQALTTSNSLLSLDISAQILKSAIVYSKCTRALTFPHFSSGERHRRRRMRSAGAGSGSQHLSQTP